MKQTIAIALLFMVAASSCEHKEPAAQKSTKFVLSDTMRHMIVLDTVKNCNVTNELALSGVVAFNENNVVKIFPRSSGQVVESKVSLGDHVSQGQVLAIIRSADVAGNYSDLAGANADVAIAKRQMDNTESLYKNGISSEKEYIEAKQGYEKALAARNKVQSLININGGGKTNAEGQYTLTAPIDGYIVEKKVAAGAFIRPDMGDNLFTISDLKNVWIYANVYEADIAKIHEGYEAKILPISYPDKTFTGKIDKVSQVLDPQSKAMKVRINLENKDMLLKPDMFTRVIVENMEGDTALCVSSKAVIPQEGKNYMVVYRNDSDLKIVQVDLLKSVGDHTYLKGGLELGDVVVTKNQILLFNQLSGQ